MISPAKVRKVLTSVENEGSHTVAKTFMKSWKIEEQVTFTHDWKSLAAEALGKFPRI